jgi:hypothetical protein
MPACRDSWRGHSRLGRRDAAVELAGIYSRRLRLVERNGTPEIAVFANRTNRLIVTFWSELIAA